MSIPQARIDLVTAVEAARATFPTPLVIQYDNQTPPDVAALTEPWLSVSIEFLDAYQGDISSRPLHRHIGAIKLTANSHQGSGTAKSLNLLRHFTLALQRKNHGIVRTMLADVRVPAPPKDNIHTVTHAVPFWFDEVVG